MKRKLWLTFFLVPVVAFGLISNAAAGTSGGEREKGDGGKSFTAVLMGANEVPSLPGSDLMGTADVTINLRTHELCWDLEYTTTQEVTAAHIHKGAAGAKGDVVFGFFNPPTSTVVVNEGCRSGPADLLADIAAHPENYYVNVHTRTHPTGAARGQLTAETEEED